MIQYLPETLAMTLIYLIDKLKKVSIPLRSVPALIKAATLISALSNILVSYSFLSTYFNNNLFGLKIHIDYIY